MTSEPFAGGPERPALDTCAAQKALVTPHLPCDFASQTAPPAPPSHLAATLAPQQAGGPGIPALTSPPRASPEGQAGVDVGDNIGPVISQLFALLQKFIKGVLVAGETRRGACGVSTDAGAMAAPPRGVLLWGPGPHRASGEGAPTLLPRLLPRLLLKLEDWRGCGWRSPQRWNGAARRTGGATGGVT